MGYEKKLVGVAEKVKKFLDYFPTLYNVYLVCCISTISGMMFGVDISSISAFIGTDQYKNYFNNPGSAIQGFITSAMALGSFFGSLACSFVSEPLGRRISLTFCAFFWCVGAAIQSSSQNRAQLIIGRFISGFGVGFGSTVAPVYGSELAPRRIRGFIGGLFQFSVTVGILIMFYISYGLHFINGVGSFRIAWGIQIIFGLVLFFGVFLLPESPRWLAKHGYWDEAEDVVAKIQAHGDKTNPDVQIEVSEIKEQIMIDEASKSVTYATLFNKKYCLRTITAIFAQIWQQLTGMNVMMYYIVYIFQMAGYTGNSNLIASSIQYVLNTCMTVPALFLLDKVGRRPVLLTGAVLMMIFQFCVAGILGGCSKPVNSVDGDSTVKIEIPKSNSSAARAVIAMCYLFVCSFACTWGVGAALSTAANWILNFAIGMYTPSSFENITWKTYCIYATFCACMFIHVLFYFPETKGKRLEEVAQMWDEHVPAWKSASWKPAVPIATDKILEKKLSVQHVEDNDNSTEDDHSMSNSEKAVQIA
ncbi:high affinity glucose transporter [Brettanomyces bruxellensis]|uniref:High affinity glucose transporter n=1 Tax=Dekkera bruxellensis TaxID=5007 RepID=A0A871R9Q5_DEKBR|nr:high affinity glucose transporter [Brettanomyces bruxellensis]QOU18850.1 high affinity glucose transporter [Brettanomyces bruxellensis]